MSGWWASAAGIPVEEMWHLTGCAWPQFYVALDLTRGSAHESEWTEVCLGWGDESGPGDEDRMIYAALAAGQYQVEGGFPCPCGGRHPARRIIRSETPTAAPVVVWDGG